MRRALAQARRTAGDGNPAFGAVVVRDGRVVAEAASREISDRDPLAHDGVLVLSAAARRLGSHALSGCTFYGTAEPCLMCSAALLMTRISRVVIGAAGEPLSRLLGPRLLRLEELAVDVAEPPPICRGVLAAESLALLEVSL
jgi:tRNA(Arg) A34 adenosine deaminase TadA